MLIDYTVTYRHIKKEEQDKLVINNGTFFECSVQAKDDSEARSKALPLFIAKNPGAKTEDYTAGVSHRR